MPNVKIKKDHLNKLKELGVYALWVANVTEQWGSYADCWLNPDSPKHKLYTDKLNRNDITFESLICYSFHWKKTNEGYEFWNDISLKFD